VFKAESTLLRRVEAVKVYLPRAGDPRNKLEQGSFEAQKQAAAAFQFPDFRIINIYHAAVLDGRFYTTMEFFDGPNLKEWTKTASLKDKWRIAHVYNDAMRHTSREDLFHGDPHIGNILVGKEDIAFRDHGTSHYSGRESGWRRHWNIVDEVMIKLLRGFESFEHYRAAWPSREPGLMTWAETKMSTSSLPNGRTRRFIEKLPTLCMSIFTSKIFVSRPSKRSFSTKSGIVLCCGDFAVRAPHDVVV
jgi:serine/threonine protein kinase